MEAVEFAIARVNKSACECTYFKFALEFESFGGIFVINNRYYGYDYGAESFKHWVKLFR